MDTSFLWTVIFVAWESPYISQNSTRFKWTPVDTDNRHLFLAQPTDSHRKLTLLMQTLHYQLSVIDVSFLSVEKLLVDGIMTFTELQSA